VSWRAIGFLTVLALGLAQMAGDVCGLPALRAIANATVASPAPKVFTRVGDREPFSSRFTLVLHDVDGRAQRLPLTPERYALLRGPYNRRNAYGAAIAAGPLLVRDAMTAAMFWEVARFALCGDAPLLRELGVASAAVERVELEYVNGRSARMEGDRVIVTCR
jgi:hypothetical protein